MLRCFFLVTLLVPCLLSCSQQYIFKPLSYKEGLNTYNIVKTVEDRFGFIWVATQDGIYRFDGKSFDVIKKQAGNKNTLCGNHIFDAWYDGQNLLYLACYEGGIDAVNIENLEVQHILCKQKGNFKLLQNGFVKKILLDSLQNLWVCGEDYTACYNLRTAQISYPLKAYYQPGGLGANCITIGPASKMIVGFDELGLIYIDASKGKVEKIIPAKDLGLHRLDIHFKSILYKDDTTILITDYGIVKGNFKNGYWRAYKTIMPDETNAGAISNAVVDMKGNFWLGAAGKLFKYDIDKQNLTEIFRSNADTRITAQNIHHLLIDRQNNLWVSTSKQLLFCSLSDNGIRAFKGNETIPMPHLYTLVGVDRNHIYATGTDGLYLVDLNSGNSKLIKQSDKLGTVHHIQQVENSSYLVSADKGMYYYNTLTEQLTREDLLRRYPEWAKYQHCYFNNSLQHGSKQYWASEEEEGLLIWDQKNATIIKAKAGTPVSKGLQENLLHNIKQDREGYAWLLGNNTLTRFDMDNDTAVQVLHYDRTGKGLKATIFFDMYDDGKNLWFGSYGNGICILSKHSGQWRYITEKDGLCNNAVYSLLPEGDTYVWAATNNGLSRIRIDDESCTNFFAGDGLQSNAFDEKGSLLWNGCLYFAGIDGFSEINLSKLNIRYMHQELSIKRIEYYKGNEKVVSDSLNQASITVPPGTDLINIYLSIPDFKNQDKYSIFFKIEDSQNGSYFPVSNNTIQLNGLSPSKYTLSIKYSDASGQNKWAYKRLVIVVQPQWYETVWFKMIVLIEVAGLFYGLYRYRLSQLKARAAIRKKLASDLHDDLGSTLTGVRIFTDLAMRQNPEPFLKQIKQGVTDAMTATRDMIWVMDTTRNNAKQLADRISSFVQPLADANDIIYDLRADNDLDNLTIPPDEQRELYLIVKEFMTNSLKYAKCSGISISITRQRRGVSILVSDNGTGFDISKVKPGKGLSSMVSRAAAIHYEATISSSPGRGATLYLVPKASFFQKKLFR